MKPQLVHSADDLPQKQFIPTVLNAFKEEDYALTKRSIKQALKNADVSTFSILDTQSGYEVRFKDKISEISFLYHYDGDKEEQHCFEIKCDTQQKMMDAKTIISSAFNELNIKHDASLTIDHDTLRMNFKTRHAYVSAMKALYP